MSDFSGFWYTECYGMNFSKPESTKLIDALAIVERNKIVTTNSNETGQSRSYGYLRLRLPQPQTIQPGQFAMLKKRMTRIELKNKK